MNASVVSPLVSASLLNADCFGVRNGWKADIIGCYECVAWFVSLCYKICGNSNLEGRVRPWLTHAKIEMMNGAKGATGGKMAIVGLANAPAQTDLRMTVGKAIAAMAMARRKMKEGASEPAAHPSSQ